MTHRQATSVGLVLLVVAAAHGWLSRSEPVVTVPPQEEARLIERTGMLVRERRYSHAIAMSKGALRSFSDSPGLRNNLAVALLDSGEVGTSIIELERAVAANPEHSLARNNLVWAHSVRREQQTSRDSIVESPDSSTDGWRKAAWISMKLGDYRAAAQMYRMVLAIDPHDVSTLNNLGWTLVLMGRNAEAESHFTRGIGLGCGQLCWNNLVMVRSPRGTALGD
jgi:Flp pilus assembly protein TadD